MLNFEWKRPDFKLLVCVRCSKFKERIQPNIYRHMINRNYIGNSSLLICLGLTQFGNILAQPEKLNPEKPNILVFIADDAGMDFGCYGNSGIHTPNIDKLAEQGLLVENAFLTAPQCSPSRSSMLSGQFAHTIGTEDLHAPLADGIKYLPTYLQGAGYFTGCMLKKHFGGKYANQQFNWYDNGFPLYFQDPEKWNNKAVDNFTDFLDASENKPFFLWTAFVDPHRAYNDHPIKKVNNPDDVDVPPYLVDSEKTRRDLADYYDEISRMDNHIGLMLEQLENRGLKENTLIVFLSDNGMPFPRAKGTVYDAGIKTPLIFAWDGVIKPGTKYCELVSTIDLAATFMDVAGEPVPEDIYSRSIRRIFTDQTIPGRDYVFSERNWHDADEHIRSVRTKKYKFILNSYIEWPHGMMGTDPSWYELKKMQKQGKLTPAQQRLFECPRPAVEIYDLEEDPYELNNVADEAEYLEIGKELALELEKWREATGDHPSHKRRKSDMIDRVTGFPHTRKIPRDYWE